MKKKNKQCIKCVETDCKQDDSITICYCPYNKKK